MTGNRIREFQFTMEFNGDVVLHNDSHNLWEFFHIHRHQNRLVGFQKFENSELLRQISQACHKIETDARNVYCIKVRAHEGNPYNESADLVAKKAIDTVDIGSSFTYREPKAVSNGKRKVPNCPDRTVQIQEKVLKSNSISRKSPKTPMKKVVITEQKRSREKEAEL